MSTLTEAQQMPAVVGRNFLRGDGSPEGVVTAENGTLYIDITVGEMYIKRGAAANTGWSNEVSSSDLSLTDGQDFTLGTTTGTKIGTATSQKLGFWNAAPVIQQASANQTAVTDNTGGSVADAIAAVVTAPSAETDSSGGTSSTTLAAQTLPTSPGTGADGTTPAGAQWTAAVVQLTALRNVTATFASRQAEDRAAIIALTDGLAKTIELVNSIRSALVTEGIIKGAA